MYDHWIQANQFHQYNIPGETMFERVVNHCVAAKFDDDGFIGKALNIRQRFDQDMGDRVSGVLFHECNLKNK